ncbi:ABC transporter permease subunit [Spirochaetia bacterium 38H-sp]|uniref:ABC transporter permease subunit n=1 Tax=Rarispira pelagica TaxID=3141764 RepID=A0ABU9UA76_9SPIR
MGRYIFKRFLGLIPTLFIIITLSFFIIRFAPGGPFDSEKKLPKQILENIEKKYHLDEPLVMQYLRYMGNLLKGDLGPSLRYQDHDVSFYIVQTLPVSLLLGVISLFVALILGLFTGALSALKRNTWVDYTFMSIAVLGISIPLFVTGPILMLIFALVLKWLPTSGWINGRGGWATLIMPVLTLSFPYYANIARLFRASVLEVLQSDYIRTARAKGLSVRAIMLRHVFKGASIPVVSYLGPAFAGIVTGSVVVEQIFRIPGLGRYFVQSAFNRDYPLIMGTVVVYSVILVVMNFIVDIFYGILDPRVSYKD